MSKLLTGHAKAILAAAITFLGALQVALAAPGDLTASELLGALVAALVALTGVHLIPNAGQADAQAVVDEVKKLVPPEAAAAIAEVVPAAGGVLKSVQ